MFFPIPGFLHVCGSLSKKKWCLSFHITKVNSKSVGLVVHPFLFWNSTEVASHNFFIHFSKVLLTSKSRENICPTHQFPAPGEGKEKLTLYYQEPQALYFFPLPSCSESAAELGWRQALKDVESNFQNEESGTVRQSLGLHRKDRSEE